VAAGAAIRLHVPPDRVLVYPSDAATAPAA